MKPMVRYWLLVAGSRPRASKLAAWEVKAAEELRRLFNERSKFTQKEFGRQFEIGSAGMVSQYLGGKRPLGLAAAIKFATGLQNQIK